MKTILVIGAGRSSGALIKYLLKNTSVEGWRIVIADASEVVIPEGFENGSQAQFILFNIHDEASSASAIANADVVISLLPAHFHPLVAKYCLRLKKHLLTASYISDEMKGLHEEALKHKLLFLNECGLDPGIDHMSAMQIVNRIKSEGGTITSFESFTGGLIAPETDPENPWRYKFTWNPRNVVTAGQGTAKYLEMGEYKYIPYQQIFKRTTKIEVAHYGVYEGYANRDSLKYRDIYGLESVQTMLRGTLRNEGFCEAWNILVQLGCCDDTYHMDKITEMTHRSFFNSFLPYKDKVALIHNIEKQLGFTISSEAVAKLQWSGLFTDESVGLETGTPAQILERILNKKWRLNPSDKDLIVMWHRFRYTNENQQKEIHASLVVKGDVGSETAMSKTVGLPLGIAAKLLLSGKIKMRGVVIPVYKEFYEPILKDLESMGIKLEENN